MTFPESRGVDGIWWPDLGVWSELEESVGARRSGAPPWAADLPRKAVVARDEVPELARGRSMTFERGDGQ
jgi:hypothetical protein